MPLSLRQWSPFDEVERQVTRTYGTKSKHWAILQDLKVLLWFFEELKLVDDQTESKAKLERMREHGEIRAETSVTGQTDNGSKTSASAQGASELVIPGTRHVYGKDDNISSHGFDLTFSKDLKFLRRPSMWTKYKLQTTFNPYGHDVLRALMNNLMILALDLCPRRRYLARYDTTVPESLETYWKMSAAPGLPLVCTVSNAKALEWIDVPPQSQGCLEIMLLNNADILHEHVIARNAKLHKQQQGSEKVELRLNNGMVVSLPGSRKRKKDD